MAKAPVPTNADQQTARPRPKPQSKWQTGRQEAHLHKEEMARIKGGKKRAQIEQEGKTARTVARATAISNAVARGFESARDVSSKQIELQQLLSGNRYSENDATDENRVSSGSSNGSGNSITQNPGAGSGEVIR